VLIYVVKLRFEPPERPVRIMGARWLLVYIAGLNVVSYLGNFGGGTGTLPFGWDMAVLAVFSLWCFRLGLIDALPPERTQELVDLSLEGP